MLEDFTLIPQRLLLALNSTNSCRNRAGVLKDLLLKEICIVCLLSKYVRKRTSYGKGVLNCAQMIAPSTAPMIRNA